MSKHVDLIKRKPSGSENRKRKTEKEIQKTIKFMNKDKYISTKNQDLNVASTSGIQANASVDQIAVEDIVDEVYRSEETSCATIARSTHGDSIGDVEQIQILGDVNTVVPNISDPANWPLTRNSKIIDRIITSGRAQTHIDNYQRMIQGDISLILIYKKLAN